MITKMIAGNISLILSRVGRYIVYLDDIRFVLLLFNLITQEFISLSIFNFVVSFFDGMSYFRYLGPVPQSLQVLHFNMIDTLLYDC